MKDKNNNNGKRLKDLVVPLCASCLICGKYRWPAKWKLIIERIKSTKWISTKESAIANVRKACINKNSSYIFFLILTSAVMNGMSMHTCLAWIKTLPICCTQHDDGIFGEFPQANAVVSNLLCSFRDGPPGSNVITRTRLNEINLISTKN